MGGRHVPAPAPWWCAGIARSGAVADAHWGL